MAKQVDEIYTDRLFLRGINEDDTADIIKWRSDPEVYRFLTSPHKITVSEHVHWLNNIYICDENILEWICIEKETCRKIGVFALVFSNNTAKISYLLSPSARHKGYAYEAVKMLVRYAHENRHVKNITAEIHKDNLPSVLLVKRLGFELAESSGDFEIFSIAME